MRQPEFWTGQSAGVSLAAAILSPLGWIYGATVACRSRFSQPYRSRAKVVCIGNLTVGGTGKTPVAIEIGRRLAERGARAVFLTRGYGGNTKGPVFVSLNDTASRVGDEPLLLAAVDPVIVARDRATGAKLADDNSYDVVIMDDGHQNFSLVKDLSLIVVDAALGFGNGRILPAGPLRESVRQGLRRADALILLGDGSPPEIVGSALPVVRARVVCASDEDWAAKRVVAFAGIGRPEKFFATLAAQGAQVVETHSYADHFVYSPSELDRLKKRAGAAAASLVTTEKDFVRIAPAEREGIERLRVRVVFEEDSLLDGLLDKVVPRTLPPQTP
jgi:tetraacyldisaccharide 4'-kinase